MFKLKTSKQVMMSALLMLSFLMPINVQATVQ